ncbi:MAG: twin-arginine translocase subunit TatC [Planctomycetota bacterium]
MADSGTGAERPELMGAMTLGEHLQELRNRLVVCLVALGAAFIGCWVFKYRLMAVLKAPHVRAMESFGYEAVLNYAGYFDPIGAQLKLCLIAAAVITSPLLIYEIWAFVAPGLFPHEKFRVIRLGVASLLCFLAGVSFGYFLFIPVALRYMVMLAGPGTRPVLMIDKYLSLFFMLTLALAVAFQTPVVVAYLIRWKILTVESLQKHRKTAIVVAFVLAAVLTPPDPLTQIMMGVTLVVLYDLGGLVGAPGPKTFKAFAKFAGIIAVVLAALVAYVEFWPVAQVTALRGAVQAGPRGLDTNQPQELRRGMEVSTREDALGRVRFGGGEGPVVHLAGNSDLRVTGPAKGALARGSALVSSGAESGRLELQAGPVALTLAGARAEVRVPEADVATVTVFEGTVEANLEGTDTVVKTGRTKTFYRGGQPADVGEAARRWQQMLGGELPPED